MRCTACGTELIPGKKFCHGCGARAALECPGCGVAVAPEFRFCPDCGREIALAGVHDTAPPATDDSLARLSRHIPEGLAHKIRAAQGAIEGERKLVTVLFCDLADSTAMAEGLDPEEYHDLLDDYLELTFREIYRFEGIVNQLAGDGMMALFGAPVAHEDAPQRALRAALAIREALAEFNLRQLAERNLTLHARIGIHTGPVVVGTIGNDLKMDYTAIGDTTNLASRLESLAAPGTILMSEATHRLVRGFFRVQPTGPLTVRGKSEPVTAYEVLGESAATTPMAIAAERGLTPFVGREEELTQLEVSYRRLLEAERAQVVGVVGDAGSGKSRLLYEFRQRLDGKPAVFFEGRCSALGQAAPYYPFITMFRRYFDLLPTDSVASACAKVAGRVGEWHEEKTERLHRLVCGLLSLPVDQALEVPPDEMKQESFDAVAHLLHAESTRAPVVLMLEDVHWIDEASRELLENLLTRLAGARLMVLLSHRPDDRLALRTQAAFTQIVLRRLSDEHVTAVVRTIAGGPLPGELEQLLMAKAEGNPFCAEEITRALLEEGLLVADGGAPRLTQPVEELRIPGTVQEVIAARLDRLGPQAKRVVQVAAVLGRQFHRAQLARLLDGEGVDVTRELVELERRGIFHRKSVLASDEYRFGESLTQEVAYESLLIRQRRQLHERVGLLLDTGPGEASAERSALLAHHFSRSDNRPKAVEALLRAARDAERLPSYRVAADFFRRAWELAEAAVAEGVEGTFRHAALEASSGLSRLGVLFGWPPVAEAERAARRGRALAEELGNTEALAALSYFEGALIMAGEREQFGRGLELAEQGLAIAERAGLKLTAMRLSRGLAITYALDGRFELARRAIDWVADELERTDHRERRSDLYVSTRWVRDSVLLLSDDLDAAQESALETYEHAVRAPNRTVRSTAAGALAQVHFLRAEYAEARRWADESLEITQAIANIPALPVAAAIALVARLELGEAVEPARYLELIDQGLAAGGTVQSTVRFVGEALLAVGALEHAERYADALRTYPVGARLREALVSAAVGELAAQLGRHEEAERAFHRALVVAEAIDARSTLAAAALGMAELAAARGDRAGGARHLERALAIAHALRLNRLLARAARLAGGVEAAAL